MRTDKNDRRIREAAGRAAGIEPRRVVVDARHGVVLVNLPNTMLMTSGEHARVTQEIESGTGIKVTLV